MSLEKTNVTLLSLLLVEIFFYIELKIFLVNGDNTQTAPTTPFSNTTIKAKTYPLLAGDIYQDAINISQIEDNATAADYYFTVSSMDHDMSAVYPGQTCIMMTFTIKSASGAPAMLVPYLDAPAHICMQ